MMVALLLFLSIFGNEIISGTVVSKSGEPVPFVMVSNGPYHAVANDKGEFKIEFDSENRSLTFRSLGYKMQVVENVKQSKLKVYLEEELFNLDEVVITAMGAEAIVTNAIEQIGKIYQLFPATTAYEYGEKINFRNAQSGTDNFIERYLLFNKYMEGYRFTSFFEFTHQLMGDIDPEIASLDSVLYQKKYFRNINTFFFEASHIPYFLDLNQMRRFNYSLIDENAEVYKIAFEGKTAKSEFDGEIWVHKDDFGIPYLKYWKSKKGLRAENLKINLMTKLVAIKKISFVKEAYEVWTERNAEGRYILKSSKADFEAHHKHSNSEETQVLANVKLNLATSPKLRSNATGYYSWYELFGRNIWELPKAGVQPHNFVITFDH